MIFLFALVLALAAGVGVRYYFVQQMSNVHPAATASFYLRQDSFALSESEDTFLYTSISRVPKPKDDTPNDNSDDNSFFDDDDDN